MNRRNAGVIRKVDELGRIVIPKDIRRSLNIADKDTAVEIRVEGNSIVLLPVGMTCLLCGENTAEKLVRLDDMSVCENCINRLVAAQEEHSTM